VAPERVALGVARGDGFARDPLFGTNAPLEPRAFLAIAAYDGQLAGVGRVVTDASWHHFVNLDLDGTGAPPGQPAFQIPATSSAPAADTPELQRIRQYFRNLATWLLPRDVRRCLRFPVILEHLARPPLFEELVVPRPETANGDELHEVGSRLVASIAAHRPRFEAEELISDALEDAVGTLERARLAGLGDRFGRLSGRRMGLAAVGTLVVSVVEKLSALETLCALDPHATFGPIAADAARFGVRRYVEGARKDLVELDDLLHKIAQ